MHSMDLVPDNSYVFKFEQAFSYAEAQLWLQHLSQSAGLYTCLLYLLLVFWGQTYMANRPKLILRKTLAVWNILLAAFSIIGFSRTLPEFVHLLSTQGLHHVMCDTSFIKVNKVSGFWSYLFVVSKFAELGDTVFIVLRKQPLIFLHWYHHLTVLVLSWFFFVECFSASAWIVVINYGVHSIMYSYYALKAMRFKVPAQISMFITSLQLIQMFVLCWVVIWLYKAKGSGLDCPTQYFQINLTLFTVLSYIILFGHFFYINYLHPKSPKSIILPKGSKEQ